LKSVATRPIDPKHLSEDKPNTSGARPLGVQLALIPGLDELLDGAALIDVDGDDVEGAALTYLNSALNTLLGCSAAEALSRPFVELVGDASFGALWSLALASGRAARFHYQLTSPKTERWLGFSISPFPEAGGVRRWLCLVRDDTSRQKRELEQSENERIAAVASLAASMAHEINNPLASITSNLEWLAAALPKLRPAAPRSGALGAELMTSVSAALVDALAGAERVENSVEHLTLLSGVEYTQREIVEVRLLLDAALRDLEPLFGGAVVERQYEDVRPVFVNERRLKQALSNLLTNAMQSIPADATLRRVIVRVRALACVRIEIEDSGAGIAESVSARLFRPFVTTKPVGVAKGLGLYLAKKIVEGGGGKIGFSALAHGTLFWVELPFASSNSGASSV
jgi:two-component system NtrC family sensor kinase